MPDPFVLAALEGLGPGAGRRALDLAAGSGRHALELARLGWQTCAWDVSGVGLGLLLERATALGARVQTRRVDVLGMSAPSEPFDLLLCTDFLDRALWQSLAGWVCPGGHVLVATFCLDWPGAKPPERFRLRPGELGQGLPALKTLRSEERAGRAGLLGLRTP